MQTRGVGTQRTLSPNLKSWANDPRQTIAMDGLGVLSLCKSPLIHVDDAIAIVKNLDIDPHRSRKCSSCKSDYLASNQP